ncbi:MAG: peptidylprolyl isomerase [Alphaproteobacteria bacterium]|nr:peptidylprolyl isomerase [Alphaproteobacteria bacterium]
MISVNGTAISEKDVLAEMQYHPAVSREAALAEAAEALVVRQLLLQRATELAIGFEAGDAASEEEAIDALLAREVGTPSATEENCRRWYDNNRKNFRAQPLFDASHILYLAPRDDADARVAAKSRATAALGLLKTDPTRFSEIARTESRCSSAGEGGHLGQIAIGETAPEIETFLLALEEGQICPIPVETDYGFHVLQLHRRIEGRDMPFAEAAPLIARELNAASWRLAVSQYIELLAGAADIQGIDVRRATSPLVQ